MPTVQQLEQRLKRLNQQLVAAKPAGADAEPSSLVLRPLHKTRRRLQRKLRMRRPRPSVPAGKPAAPPSAAPDTPPAEPAG